MSPHAQLKIIVEPGQAVVTRVMSMTDALELHDTIRGAMKHPDDSEPITVLPFLGDAPATLAGSAVVFVEVIPIRDGLWKGGLWKP